MDAVFLDTNAIRNPDLKCFFGQIAKFQQLARIARIIVPRIVIDEIKWQKMDKARRELDTFRSNYFSSLVDYNYQQFQQHVEDQIQHLYQNASSEIAFLERALKPDINHLDRLQSLAVTKTPPFDTGSDKGFKDACIYLTIIQYLEEAAGSVFLFTNDGKLKEAFSAHDRVKIVKEPDDYFNIRQGYFKEDYFLENLVADISERISDGENIGLFGSAFEVTKADISVQNITLNSDDEWVVGVNLATHPLEFTVDFYSREILRMERL
jgi:rRNA-processing protein FCF1